MSEFVWQSYYRLGNEKVDQQHRQLFELANELVASKNQDTLIKNMMRLYQHVREHFQAEEAFMKLHAYPDFETHINTHNLMLEKLVDVSEKIQQQQWQLQDVLLFMREWITHIVEEDAVIIDYFQTNK
ncbi:bacteriohemerythrin [Methylomonas sp. 2BW1-5-20]|uniref:bacteriohemerythrin n=1 Tax=Methylomonas sp. 2BW1-5-20 TaxID=3376686 RepID=UPI004050C196